MLNKRSPFNAINVMLSRPYINAETSGGGFPGWGTNVPGLWRTSNASYVEAYQSYIKTVGAKIAENQITNGGPVILVQVRYKRPPLMHFDVVSFRQKTNIAAGKSRIRKTSCMNRD